MCDLVSWIEKDDKNHFLTDKEVFSERGQKVLKYCLQEIAITEAEEVPGI